MPGVSVFNAGAEDPLLLDASRSQFTNGGYVRVADHAIEYKDIDSHITPNLGSTLEFIVPKAGDLLGPCDLMLEFNQPDSSHAADTYSAWVESIGYAMIDEIVFTVGSHRVEVLSGDHLNILNELMKRPEQKLGNKLIGKTGDSALKMRLETSNAGNSATAKPVAAGDFAHGRLITSGTGKMPGKKLIVPLGLFFTKHPSMYFPIGAIAGAHEVRISVKLRNTEDLILTGATDYLIGGTDSGTTAGQGDGKIIAADVPSATVTYPTWNASVIKSSSCKLRCHYAHVTGPEATRLISQEHVRLIRVWQDGGGSHNFSVGGGTPQYVGGSSPDGGKPLESSGEPFTMDINLSFLHPVQQLIITIRKRSELSTSKTARGALTSKDQGASIKNRFAYQGSGRNPNVDRTENVFKSNYVTATGATGDIVFDAMGGASPIETTATGVPLHYDSFLDVQSFKLLLNGQDRHPSLAADGLDKEYLMERIMPMMHSSTDATHEMIAAATSAGEAASDVMKQLHELHGRKEIYAYPFCLNPEGSNPSGHVNFSKVSHAKLSIKGKAYTTATNTDLKAEDYQVDVYGVSFNWCQIKDGRALIAFA